MICRVFFFLSLHLLLCLQFINLHLATSSICNHNAHNIASKNSNDDMRFKSVLLLHVIPRSVWVSSGFLHACRWFGDFKAGTVLAFNYVYMYTSWLLHKYPAFISGNCAFLEMGFICAHTCVRCPAASHPVLLE